MSWTEKHKFVVCKWRRVHCRISKEENKFDCAISDDRWDDDDASDNGRDEYESMMAVDLKPPCSEDIKRAWSECIGDDDDEDDQDPKPFAKNIGVAFLDKNVLSITSSSTVKGRELQFKKRKI